MFAINGIDEADFVNEVADRIVDVDPFDFRLNVATVNRDDSGDFYHEFLVPDIGYADIVKLHDRLYSGLFLPHLRSDIDFIPHIGIGDNDNASVSKKRIDELNAKGTLISGSIDRLDVLEYTNGVVSTIESMKLTEI